MNATKAALAIIHRLDGFFMRRLSRPAQLDLRGAPGTSAWQNPQIVADRPSVDHG